MDRPRGPKDFLDAARDPATQTNQLDELADSPYSFVRTAVAIHPNAGSPTLDRLVPSSAETYADQELLRALASNPNATAATLARVAKLLIGRLNGGRDNHVAFEAGIALFGRTDTPLEILLQLLGDETTSTEFRKVAARESGRPDVLAVLKQDRSERVRRAADRDAAHESR
jgi:hypothetical protein